MIERYEEGKKCEKGKGREKKAKEGRKDASYDREELRKERRIKGVRKGREKEAKDRRNIERKEVMI